MSLTVTALMLAAAFMHAAWNALIKSSTDVTLDTALVAGSAGLVAVLLVPLTGLPAPSSWPFLAASVVIHQAYYATLAAAYRHGDLSYTYPLMRGSAPLILAVAGAVLLADRPTPLMWTGIALISAGVLWIGGTPRRAGERRARAVAYALANAAVIATYTLVDGIGVRRSENPLGYVTCLFVFIGLPYCLVVMWHRRRSVAAHARARWGRSVIGASMSIASYGIALWAMTVAPVAAIAALRETSVVFATLIGAYLLKEPLGAHRIAGASIVVAGVACLRL